MKKVLYISNYRPKEKNILRRLGRKLRGYSLCGQDGFFVGSLYAKFDVEEHRLNFLREEPRYINRTYDAIFINFKADVNSKGLNIEDLQSLRKITLPKIFVLANAEAYFMPEDNFLDHFDFIFKREHYLDLERYSISAKNRQKIFNTMLCCPILGVNTRNAHKIKPSEFGFKEPSDLFKFEVCFSGTTTSKLREVSLEALRGAGIQIYGGLQMKGKVSELAKSFQQQAFNKKQYVEAIRLSKINFAIEGIGEFTYRHLELLFLCAFMISSPSIRGLKFPIPLVEGKHYVCYDNEDDLIDKVRYYLKNNRERIAITLAGRMLFEEFYDFKKHGEYISKSIFEGNYI